MTNPYMEIAIQEARMAAEEGEIPVGAVIVKGNIVISRAHNLREKMGSATAHAEILAIDEGLQNSRPLASGRLRPVCNA